MSSSIKHDGDVRDSYLDMIKEFPLVSIRDDEHLEIAQKVLDSLFAREPLDEGEEQYLDALTDLIAYYEANSVVFEGVDDVEILEHLMKARGLSQAELAEGAGVPKSTISEFLAGRRSMNLEHMRKFADFFCIEPAAFVKPGKCKK
jgi:HTH-type transcriptional regulator/antitoxin HigA